MRLQDISAESLLVISRAVEQRFEQLNMFFADEDIEQYLNEVLDRLITLQERERHNLKIRIMRSHIVNAFGYPQGTIFINISLLAKLNNEAQLAAVLSHELVHIINNHAEKSLKKLKERSADEMRIHPNMLFLLNSHELEKVSANGTGLTALNAIMRGYSREFEREADSLGVLRMAEAGYPHEEFLNLLLLLRDYIISENIPEQSFLNTHPRITERIRNYHRIVNDGSFGGKFSVCEGCDVFKERIKKALYENVRVNLAWGDVRLDKAYDQIEELLASDSCDTEALILKGDVERRLSPRSTHFFIWYERALECDPANVAALRAIGYASYSIGDFQKAHEYLSRYCEIAENAADIGTVRIMLNKSEEHLK